MKVSILMPSYNQGRYIEAAIRSVLEQSYADKELIVIDGGSTDETVAILRRYEDRLKFWVSEPDRGQAHALNKALEHASGEIMGWLNSDDIYLPGAIRAATSSLSRHPDAPYVHGDRILLDSEGRVLGCSALPPFTPSAFGYNVCSETTFWRRSVMEKAGVFREEASFVMDMDFFSRLFKCGSPYKLDRLMGGFRCHPESKSSTMQDVCRQEGGQYWAEHFPNDPQTVWVSPPLRKGLQLFYFLACPRILTVSYIKLRFARGHSRQARERKS